MVQNSKVCFFSIVFFAAIVSGNAMVKYLSSLPVNSAELLSQIYASKIIESSIEKDPLIISELVQQAPLDPIRTPIVLATFHAWSTIGESAAEKALQSRYGSLFTSATVSSIAKFSSGLAAGSIGTRLTIEAVFGDLSQYASDPKKRAEMGAQLTGAFAGVPISSAVQMAGAYIMRGNLAPHPVANILLKGAGGVAYFLTADKAELASKVYLRTWLEGKNLDKVIGDNQKDLLSKFTPPVKSCLSVQDTANRLRLVREAYSKYRVEVMKPMVDFESRHLKNMFQVRSKHFQKMKLAEWLLDGADKNDPEYRSNILNWRDVSLGKFNAATKLVDVNVADLNSLVSLSRIESAKEMELLDKEHELGRQKKAEDLRTNPIFIKSFKSQIENQLLLLERISPQLGSQVKEVKEDLHKLFWINYHSETNRNRIKQSLSNIKQAWLKMKDQLSECDRIMSELAISDINFVGNEFVGHLEMTYFKNLSERAESMIVEDIRKVQRSMKPSFDKRIPPQKSQN